MDRAEFSKIFAKLKRKYPGSRIMLDYTTEFELLVAVMLSAQCTDVAVNKVTASLFKKYKSVKAFAKASFDELSEDIRGVGLYRNKAKNIIATANIIVNDFAGNVPKSMDELLCLPGVARKTANVVLSNTGAKLAGIAVDTHVERISVRLGFSAGKNPKAVEKDLMQLVPKRIWGVFSYYIIEHGRALCRSRNPLCAECFLQKDCMFLNQQ